MFYFCLDFRLILTFFEQLYSQDFSHTVCPLKARKLLCNHEPRSIEWDVALHPGRIGSSCKVNDTFLLIYIIIKCKGLSTRCPNNNCFFLSQRHTAQTKMIRLRKIYSLLSWQFDLSVGTIQSNIN